MDYRILMEHPTSISNHDQPLCKHIGIPNRTHDGGDITRDRSSVRSQYQAP
jgi:hypothetical protein